MQRVAMARQCADGEAGIGETLAVGLRVARACKQPVGVDVIATGPAAGADFDRRHVLERAYGLEHLGERQPAEHGSEDAEFHADRPPPFATPVSPPPPAPQPPPAPHPLAGRGWNLRLQSLSETTVIVYSEGGYTTP
jgi:hypothetical protein